jgi:hypothetical protein
MSDFNADTLRRQNQQREVATGRARIFPRGKANWITSVAISPDGKILASLGITFAGALGELKLWDVATVKKPLAHMQERFFWNGGFATLLTVLTIGVVVTFLAVRVFPHRPLREEDLF